MTTDANKDPLDLLLSKFQAVDSLWKDIRQHDQVFTTPRHRRPASSSLSRGMHDLLALSSSNADDEVKNSLLTPLLEETPTTVGSSSIEETEINNPMSLSYKNELEHDEECNDDHQLHNRNTNQNDQQVPVEQDHDGLHRSVISPTSDEEGVEHPWYTNPLQISAMISNFSTSYNVVNVSLVLPILEQLWASSTTVQDTSAVASSLLAGMMVGQVVGGCLGDSKTLGRMGALVLVMVLQIGASIASAFCFKYPSLIVWRFILGIGAGGVYPLAAVLSAEQQEGRNSSQSKSLHMVVLTFSMQGVGFLAVPVVAVTLLYTVSNLQIVWRLILAFGCIPGIVLMLLQCWTHHRTTRPRRARVPTSEQEDDEDANVTASTTPPCHDDCSNGNTPVEPATLEELHSPESYLHHGMWDAIRHEDNLVRKLLGTARTWFLFDVLFYGNTLFQPIVIAAAFGAQDGSQDGTEDPIERLRQTAMHSLVLTLIALPGYAVAGMVLGSKSFGCTQTPRFVMLQGFLIMSLLYLTIGICWVELRRIPSLLVVLYSLTFFFANYGPNTTTFVLPSLVYSPECRSTLNGMSAAAGKLGAWTGATLFAPTADALGDATVLILCSLISIIAFFMTVFFVPRIGEERQSVDNDAELRAERVGSDNNNNNNNNADEEEAVLG